jgi:hypothetical protein
MFMIISYYMTIAYSMQKGVKFVMKGNSPKMIQKVSIRVTIYKITKEIYKQLYLAHQFSSINTINIHHNWVQLEK